MTDAKNEQTVLRCAGVQRRFTEGDNVLEVLRGVDLSIERGERIAIVGASGSGKTTLLQVLGGLDAPDGGSIHIAGEDLSAMSDRARGDVRNRHIGFVYQFHHLLPEFTAAENVAMPLLIRRASRTESMALAAQLLERVGLGQRLSHRPSQLSGGERQRAAVARALITRPALVLADEPTGNLDQDTGQQVLSLMLELNQEYGTSLVIVTHDSRVAGSMDRELTLEQGQLRTLR